MPKATSKPVEVDYFPLDTAQACADALEAALAIGFRGNVGAYVDDNSVQHWHVELSGGPQAQKAIQVTDGDTVRFPTVGDVFVWTGAVLLAYTATDFTANYQVMPI